MAIKLGNYIAFSTPNDVFSNADLCKLNTAWTEEKVAQKLGIRSRFVLSDEDCVIDLMKEAYIDLVNYYHNVSVDCIINVSNTSELIAPGNGHLLVDKLNLEGLKVFDLNSGCSGYVDGIILARSLLLSGLYHSIVILTGDTYTRKIPRDDFGNRSLFGEAYTASLLTKHDIAGWHLGEMKAVTYSGYNELKISSDSGFYMDGKEVFNFAVNKVVDVLDGQGNHYDYYVFHQANRYMINYLSKKLNITSEKILWNMEEFGNTVSSSIPLVLSVNHTKSGSFILVGFGIGLSVSTLELFKG